MPSPLASGRLRPGVIAASLLAITSHTQAVPVSATFEYTCVFPLIEEQPIEVDITSNMPEILLVGEMTEPFQLDAVAQVSADAWNGLDFVGSQRLSGNVEADSSITGPNLSLPLTIPLEIADTALPDSRTAFSVSATGETPSLALGDNNLGQVEIRVGDLVMELEPVDSNGLHTGLGIFQSECSLDSGQSGLLHTITVANATSSTYSFRFTGEAGLKNRTPLTLSGSLELDHDPADNALSGDMLLDDSSVSMKLIRFFNTLSLDARAVMTPSGPVEGVVSSDTVSVSQAVDIQLQDIQLVLFGFPVSSAGMGQCITEAPVMLDMESVASGEILLQEGGKLEGQFDLPDFKDCGVMTGVINSLLSGPDNDIQLMLTPEA